MVPTRATTEILEPALDAIACNHTQAALLFNPTPEVDSLAEVLAGLAHDAPRSQARVGLTLLRQILDSNQCECDLERQIAGAAETATTGHARLGARAIAQRVGPALDLIDNPRSTDAIAFVHAVRTVDQVIADCPVEQLLSPAVRHELRDRRYQLLEQLHTERAR